MWVGISGGVGGGDCAWGWERVWWDGCSNAMHFVQSIETLNLNLNPHPGPSPSPTPLRLELVVSKLESELERLRASLAEQSDRFCQPC